MPPTTSYDFGDVATKKRPAVIISHPSYQQSRPDIILMAITSQIRQPLSIGDAILQDWRAAGLAKPSVLKPLIATIEQNRIIKTLGRLSATDRRTLNTVLQSILGG